jgi:TetR/AcrR family transcriptional regulator, transcriptional repressor for nem operon
VGRHREFDPEEALEAAMEVFWQKGYRHTAVSDLLAAMGINRWSMYETFGDKQQIFVKALSLYRRRWSAFIAKHLQRPGSPKAALVCLLRAMGREIVDDKLARGCLLANSSFELAHLEPEARELVLSSLQSLEDTLTAVITRAQEAGEIPRARDARELARFLIAAVNGIRSAGKVEPRRGRLAALVELSLSVLD